MVDAVADARIASGTGRLVFVPDIFDPPLGGNLELRQANPLAVASDLPASTTVVSLNAVAPGIGFDLQFLASSGLIALL